MRASDCLPGPVSTDSAAPSGPAVSTRGLWTLDETAAFLRVSGRTLRRAVSAKRIRCVRIGRRLLFDPADVSRFVAARKE
jgi:excisionase family DNA binding protein